MTRHAATLLLAAALALAHGGHEHGEEDTSIPYLQRHVSSGSRHSARRVDAMALVERLYPASNGHDSTDSVHRT